jgi:hypothetical protein
MNELLHAKLENLCLFITKEDNGYLVSWGDYVANSWDEKCATLSQALIRAAMLARIDEGDSDRFFTVSEEELPAVSEKFFNETLSRHSV